MFREFHPILPCPVGPGRSESRASYGNSAKVTAASKTTENMRIALKLLGDLD